VAPAPLIVIDPAGKSVGVEVVDPGAVVEAGVWVAVPQAAKARLATAVITNIILIECFILFISPFMNPWYQIVIKGIGREC
jgi:hypothetical protein